jgi:hypothetical protein
LDELEPFVTVLNNEGYFAELSREDSIPYLQISHADYRLLTIGAAMQLARRLKASVTYPVRFQTLDAQTVHFFIYDRDVSHIDESQLYGTDIDTWLNGVLADLPQ